MIRLPIPRVNVVKRSQLVPPLPRVRKPAKRRRSASKRAGR